jgi:hypothetical protein
MQVRRGLCGHHRVLLDGLRCGHLLRGRLRGRRDTLCGGGASRLLLPGRRLELVGCCVRRNRHARQVLLGRREPADRLVDHVRRGQVLRRASVVQRRHRVQRLLGRHLLDGLDGDCARHHGSCDELQVVPWCVACGR